MWNNPKAMNTQNPPAQALAARLALQDAFDCSDDCDEHPMLLAPRVMRRPSRTASLESSLDSPGVSMDDLMDVDELNIERKMSQSRRVRLRRHDLSPFIMSPLELMQASPEVCGSKKKESPDALQTSPGPPIPSESPLLPLNPPLRSREGPPKPPPTPRHMPLRVG